MVVIVEPRRSEGRSLRVFEHAQSHARFEAKRLDAAHHLGERGDVPVRRAAPCCTHAEALRTVRLGGRGSRDHFGNIEQLARPGRGVELGRLAAVAAILRAAAGLDGQQLAHLDFVRREARAVHGLRLPHQIGERQIEQRCRLGDRPVGAGLGKGHTRFESLFGALRQAFRGWCCCPTLNETFDHRHLDAQVSQSRREPLGIPADLCNRGIEVINPMFD